MLDKTNFYSEMGGQVADTGLMMDDADTTDFVVKDVRKFASYALHVGLLQRGAIKVGDQLTLNYHGEVWYLFSCFVQVVIVLCVVILRIVYVACVHLVDLSAAACYHEQPHRDASVELRAARCPEGCPPSGTARVVLPTVCCVVVLHCC